MFKQGVLRRWFTEGGVKYFKSGAVRTITNMTKNKKKKKKEFLHSFRFISKILFVDAEQFSEVRIFSQVF